MGKVVLTVLMGVLLGAFGIGISIIGYCYCRRKKYLLGIFLILSVIVCVIGVVIFSAFGYDNKFYWLLVGIIGVVSAVSAFLLENQESGDFYKAIVEAILMGIISIFFVIIMSEMIVKVNGDTHVFYEPDSVEVFEDGVKFQYDVEQMPAEGYSVIKDKIEEMKENGEKYYEGAVKLKYSCCYPLVRNNHDECSCTDERLCDICEKYVNDVQVVYD